jgi:hypothetical protein
MASNISLQPQELDLTLYAGDGIEFKLICTDTTDAPIPIAGIVKSQIRHARLDTTPVMELSVDLAEGAQGKIALSLTGEQTQDIVEAGKKGKFSGVWDVEWTPTGAEPRTLCQGKVECTADVTR